MPSGQPAAARAAHWDCPAREQPAPQPDTLLVGLGSHQGDDCAGWCVACAAAAALQNLPAECCRPTVRLARQPLELLHWCCGCARLVIVDACLPDQCSEARLLPSPGTWRRWRWPHIPALRLRPATSHDFGLLHTLALGSRLGILPPEVEIWGLYIAPHSLHTVRGLSGPADPHDADALAPARSSPSGARLEGRTSSWACDALAAVRPTPNGLSTSGADICGLYAQLVSQLSPSVRAALPKIVDALVRSLAAPASV